MNSKSSFPKKNSSSARSVGMGAVLSWQKSSTGIEGVTESARFKITVYSSGTIRVQACKFDEFDPNPYSVVAKPNPGTFALAETLENLTLTTDKLKLELNLTSFALSFFDLNGNLLNADDSLGISWIGTEVANYKQVQVNEKFIGLGEKTGNLDRSGKAYTNWNTDYFAYGTGDDPLYMSIPFYIGVHPKGVYGIFMDNTHKTVFNFGASNNRFIYFSGEDGDMDYYFIHEPTIAGIISSYTDLTGKMNMPPKWALGFQQCRYSYYPDKEVLTLANTFRDKDMPADVIYLDIHHMEAYKVFTFDGVKFPDAKSMIARLKELGFKVVVIMDPGIKTEKGYLPYEEGKEKDLFIKYPDGIHYEAQVWPGWCAFPDFTKAETREWWAEKMAFYTEAGVDGFWTDMNEPASWGQFTPNLIEFDFDGNTASHRKARNIYGMQMARAAMEGSVLQRKDERPFVLTRSGFAGIQRYAAAWTGDNVASEDHMMAGIRLINSLGLSGVAFSGYDIGGFAGEASKSLFARWMSIGTFSPLFRAHSMINSNDAEPWAFGEEVEEISRNYMKLRYKILPTIYSSFYSSSQTGLPIVASLAIDYPNDQNVYKSLYQNQYLFCNTFLVAPVESYKEIIKVYLPEGTWYNLYTDGFQPGLKSIYADSPLNYLPVYVKGGSIFTMQSDIAHTGQNHDGVLQIHLYSGIEESSFTHYEDDGNSLAYQKDQFLKRELSYFPEEKKFILEEAEGSFISEFQSLRIYLHGFQTEKITIKGKSIILKNENYTFLGRLTEFDPLPEHEHPFLAISGLKYFEYPNSSETIVISGLF
ncbi:MAG: glycoside hydrolase family 31 protein [Algoriphagus sp.]|nr:glycoside hydrolase family 31 protein [Algoriphagus sp.]